MSWRRYLYNMAGFSLYVGLPSNNKKKKMEVFAWLSVIKMLCNKCNTDTNSELVAYPRSILWYIPCSFGLNGSDDKVQSLINEFCKEH